MNQRMIRTDMTRWISVLFLVAAVTVVATSTAGASEPLATAAIGSGPLSLDLTSVVRKHGVLTVQWSVRNTGDAGATTAFSLSGSGIPRTYVLDETNGIKYLVLTDEQERSLATDHRSLGSYVFGIPLTLAPGERRELWMKLAAPPDEVSQVTLMFDDVLPLEDLPVTDVR